jgi:hypothetical protein
MKNTALVITSLVRQSFRSLRFRPEAAIAGIDVVELDLKTQQSYMVDLVRGRSTGKYIFL